MYKTIVVALDLATDGDRAVAVADSLRRLGDVRVELLTVSSPAFLTAVDSYELHRRAVRHGRPGDRFDVIHADDTARAIVDHVASRDALLIMATSGKRPLTGALLGSVTRGVLELTERPVLLVGPEVPTTFTADDTTLVACVDDLEMAAGLVAPMLSWVGSFRTSPPWITQVVAPGHSGDAIGQRNVSHLVELLAAQGINASGRLLHHRDPVAALEENADTVDGPVYVVSSARYTDGRHHWHSTTRDLIHRATRPVLVVPARPAPIRARHEATTRTAMVCDKPFFDGTVNAGSMPGFQSPLLMRPLR
jgi:nucleotide-binding universal stress UspA family protein